MGGRSSFLQFKCVTLHNFNALEGAPPGFLLCYKTTEKMIDKQLLTATVDDAIAGTDIFVVDIKVSPDNSIVVELDSPEGLDIDTCAEITRKIEAAFDRDVEDYDLEVGSAGITAPFKVRGQYLKNIGNEVEVLTKAGQKLKGVLVEVAENGDFTIEVPTKVKAEGAKRPEIVNVAHTFAPADCKKVNYLLKF